MFGNIGMTSTETSKNVKKIFGIHPKWLINEGIKTQIS